MKMKTISKSALFAATLLFIPHTRAQIPWTGGNGDFFDPAHWTGGVVPGPTDIAQINDGSTATIAATSGEHSIGAIALGDVEGGTESGHVIMNGGTLKINDEGGNPKGVLGLSGTLSTFIMNGGTIFFDGPDKADLAGSTAGHGNNELDWEVGEKGKGRFEMHNDAVMHIADDLKIAENALGEGSALIDGNAHITPGSGISVSSGGDVEQSLTIAGNAVVDSGNSMGAGSPLGHTDEGYLTMATSGGHARVTIQDNGTLNIRRLTARDGVSIITVKNHGGFHIFDVLHGKGFIDANTPPDRPAEAGPGSDNNNSTYPSTGAGDATITLQDDAQMTVNSAPPGGRVQGLGISAPRADADGGGKGILIVKDRASFRVEQNLELGTGRSPDTSDGTLEVVGPDAKVSIGGNLNMAVDNDGVPAGLDADQNPAPGKSTLSEVISSATQATINITGTARIAQGNLKVKLQGYKPATGDTYTVLKAGTVDGQFAQTDFSEAALGAGLAWDVQYKPDSVVLKVTGQVAPPRTITVTTAVNVNPPAGETSLLQAMTGLQEGDTIKFNIPGAGPHFIETPPDGYPLITVDGVTIDGYTQPGSSANSNTLIAANNAKIQIVLDSRNGNFRLLDFAGTTPNDDTGYGDTEAAVIGVLSAKNVTVRGLSILTIPLAGEISVYGVSFAKGASGHVAGCWIGTGPDGTTVPGPAIGISGFRYRTRDESNTVLDTVLINDVVVGVAVGASNGAADANVIVGVPGIPIEIEGNNTRISGNFLNVFPDGLHDFNPPLVDPDNFSGTFEGNIEIGRGGNNSVIGIDGDGVNDANERNVFSGVLPESMGGYDHNIEFYGQTPGTNIVVAGNYFGIGVDGTTRFTNGVPVLNAAGGSAQFRFGSDFDGVSDALEANLCYNNWPPDMFPTTGAESFFDELSTGAILSARGNVMVNNFPFPVTAQKADSFLNPYYAKALVDVSAGIVPVLSADTTISRLAGKVPVANADYPTTIIDLYAADPEGIAYGQTAGAAEYPNGYVQGKTYIGSFVDNSAADKNKNAGEFDFDISAFELKGSLLTITATYSQSPAGTHNAIALTSPFSETVEVTFLPGSIESVGLSRITPDTPVINPGLDKLGNWEPYASMLGNKFFLIEGNTFAEGTTDKQRYVVTVQPVDGTKPGKLGEGFYADDGTPYNKQINGSRQNGNPGRVAGDERPGALNFIVGGEASPHAIPAFRSDNRWDNGFEYQGASLDEDPNVSRYGIIQTFKLNPDTLDRTPLMKAIDSANGRLTSGAPPDDNLYQNTRFGGDLAGLDNGNFVSVIEDRTKLWNPNGNAVVATIIAPDGTIVKDTWKVADGDIWSNVAAYKGGFAVRASGIIYFYDNAGTLKGQANQNTSGETYDPGRGDGTRIGGHINSPYIFLVGKVSTANVVKLSVWDSRDQSFVTTADVSEGAFTGGFDRANLAVDALNRVAVGWVSQPAGYEMAQVAARVMAFNEGTKTITALTKSFLPFINAAQTGGIHTFQMSLAMTTKQICVAAKGEINLQDKPELGADSPSEINFYTVFTHPDPKDDPTPPVGTTGNGPKLTITRSGGNITITWDQDGFTLQTSPLITGGTWTAVTTTGRSYTTAATAGTAFFRLNKP